MTDELTKDEKLARAIDNVRSGGRVFDRRLAAQVAQELRAQSARIAELEAAWSKAVVFLRAVQEHGDWDDGCFYYNKRAAPELQRHLRDMELALRDLAEKEPAP